MHVEINWVNIILLLTASFFYTVLDCADMIYSVGPNPPTEIKRDVVKKFLIRWVTIATVMLLFAKLINPDVRLSYFG